MQIADGKIVYAGKQNDRMYFAAEREKDCRGNLLVPGFCNAHAHSAMTLFRGIADDLPLREWLFDRIFPLEDCLTEEDVYWGTMLAAAEYVRGGTTAVADMYFFHDTAAKALRKSGMAVALCCGTNDIGGGDVKEHLKTMESRYHAYEGKERLKYILGLHAEYTCSDALLEGTADLAATLGAPTYIHCSETLKEVGECSVRRGMTPVEYLHKIGFFDCGGIIAHGTYLEKTDIELLKEKNVTVASNPSSNLKLASGVAPVYTMLKNGLRVALGTDGAASNNALSMFREMYLMSCLQKERMKDLGLSTPQSLALNYLFSRAGQEVCATELHALFGVSKSTISASLKGLREKGYVEMSGVPGDDRKKRIVLTDKAYAVKQEIDAGLMEQERRLCRGIPPGRLEALEADLETMLRNVRPERQ